MIRIPLILILAFSLGQMQAQNIQPDWYASFGGNASETVSRSIQATNGQVWIVGETASQTKGGKDAYLVLLDPSTGKALKEARFGGAKDDGFFDVVQTYNGLFLLGGYTESTAKGGREAWLVLADERGEKLKEWVWGSPGKDEIRRLGLNEQGHLLFAGIQNGQSAGDLWLGAWSDGNVLWEKQLGNGAYQQVAALAAGESNSLLICGNTAKSGDIFLLKTNAQGEMVWSKTFGGKDWEECLDMALTRDGGIALAGLTRSKGAGDLDAWLLKTSRDGALLWDKTFGEADMDLANTLSQTEDGGFLLAGASRSFRSGARKSKAFLVKTNSGGEQQWRDYYGQGNDERAVHALSLHNGALLVAGLAPGAGGSDDAWCFRLSDPMRREMAMRDQIEVNVSPPVLFSADNTSIKPGENGFLAFKISNTAGMDLSDLRVEVENPSSAGMLDVWETVYAGSVADRADKWVRIPVKGGSSLQDGQNTLKIRVYSGAKSLYETEAQVATHLPQAASLQIADYQFSPSTRSDEITLSVQVSNAGDFNSQVAEAVFQCPPGIQPLGAVQVPLGVIAARSRRELRFSFVKTSQYRDAMVGIVCVVKEGGQEKVRKTLEWRALPGQTITASGPIMIWTDPAPHELGTNKIRRGEKEFEFKMTVVSSTPLTSKNFKVRSNGVELDGSKFNEQELSAPKQENRQYTYTYRNKIPLGQGENKLEVLLDGKASDPLIVEFAPERANLHIVAIGPEHADLKFTAQDARDFAAAFKGQGGPDRLYPEVLVHELTAPEQTTLTGIKQAMYDLSYQWKDQLIKPNDVLIVFLSSHGKIVENRFKILQTGYNPKYENLSIDFKSDILEVLNGISCKKLIFLDACHSGGAKEGFGALSNAVIDLARTQPGVGTLSSCRSDEKSYEAPTWQNGAFTEAILEAISNKSCIDGGGAFLPDADGDGILRLGELYDFLQRRVPSLVKAEIPNAPTSQIPFMPDNQLDREMPLFVFPK